jgi:hypothetical protein
MQLINMHAAVDQLSAHRAIAIAHRAISTAGSGGVNLHRTLPEESRAMSCIHDSIVGINAYSGGSERL